MNIIIFRERRPGSIDVHPNIDAIVLNYEVDVQILGPKENIIHGEKKVCLYSANLLDQQQFIIF